MSYQWWKFIHLLGVAGFFASHGTSMAATWLLGRMREPEEIAGILRLSGATVGPFYVSTLLLLVGGVGAAFVGHRWGEGWIWISLILLIVVGVLMFPLARGYYRRLRLVIDLMDSGTVISAGDFSRVLASGNPLVIAGTGTVALLLILFLMVIKPF